MRCRVVVLGVLLSAGLITPLSAATTYTYDALGRLWKVCYDNGNQIVYGYDKAGNRSQVAVQSPCS